MGNQNLPGGRAYYTGKNAYASQAFELDTRRQLQELQNQLLTLQNALTVASTISAPSGAVLSYAGATAPTGWVLCDGSSLLRSAYPNLFAAIGTTWGSADAFHFTVPDLRGRTPIGAGTGSGLTTRTLAATGGEETHVLVTAELAAHNHGVTDPGHQHTALGHIFLPNGTAPAWTATSTNLGGSNENTNTATTGISTQNAGSGTAHNNMQPFTVVNWIIKT